MRSFLSRTFRLSSLECSRPRVSEATRERMQLKRKGIDDAAVFQDAGVLNSPKRLRQELPAILEEPSVSPSPSPIPEVFPVEVPNDTPVREFPPPALVITEPEADDRAIVLYKPLSSPLFPGGPATGSPLQVSAAFPQGFKWSRAFKQRLGVRLETSPSGNHLAVVPYTPPSVVLVQEEDEQAGAGTDSQGGRVIIEDITDQLREEEENAMQVEEAEPMDMEADDMAVDAGPAAPLPATPFAMPQHGPPPPWQQFNTPPPYTPVMWST